MFTIMRDNKHEERFDLDSLELAGDEMLTVDGGLQADLLKNGDWCGGGCNGGNGEVCGLDCRDIKQPGTVAGSIKQ